MGRRGVLFSWCRREIAESGSRLQGGWVSGGIGVRESGGVQSEFRSGEKSGVKIEEANEGVKRLAGGWEGPIGDEVELGGSRAVAGRAEVDADPFDTVEEEVAFFGVEG